jgi:phage terminase small subunit
MAKPAIPSAPKHLSPASRKAWQAIAYDYELAEPHHLLTLTGALESADRAAEARVMLEREGLTYVDRFGQPHAHPAVAIEKDSLIRSARLWRELSLSEEFEHEARLPRHDGSRS